MTPTNDQLRATPEYLTARAALKTVILPTLDPEEAAAAGRDISLDEFFTTPPQGYSKPLLTSVDVGKAISELGTAQAILKNILEPRLSIPLVNALLPPIQQHLKAYLLAIDDTENEMYNTSAHEPDLE